MSLRPATAAAAAASSKNRESALNRELGLPNLQQSSNVPAAIPQQQPRTFRTLPTSVTASSSATLGINSAISTTSTKMNESIYRSLSLVTPADVRGIQPTSQQMRRFNPIGLGVPTISDGFSTQFSTNPAVMLSKDANIGRKPIILEPTNNNNNNSIQQKTTNNTTKINNTNNNSSNSIVAGPMPLLLSENSHCFVCGTLLQIALIIHQILEQHDVEVQFKPEKCKWIGSIYERNRKLSLRVFLYRVQNVSLNDTTEKYILEFQRRKGCPLLFANLYQDVCKDLAEHKILCNRDGTLISPKDVETVYAGSRRSFEPLELPEGFAEFKVTVDAFKPLIDMAQSEYVDVQQEAMREIANQANNVKTRQVLGEAQEIIPVLVNGLTSPDADVRHCACSALESFSKDKIFQEKIADRGGVQKFCQLLAASRLDNMDRETRRVLCRATANLASQFKDIIRDCDVRVFEDLAGNSDQKIKEAAQQILKAIKA